MAFFSALMLVVVLSLVLYGAYTYLQRGRNAKLPLPPGPKPLPLVGNILDLPPSDQPEWQHWLKHKDVYGPISSVTVLGTTIVVLNDAKLAIELLEKRSAVTATRPKMTFAGEMCGWDNLLGLINAPEKMRTMRKQFHAIMGTPSALAPFLPVQESEVERFLFRVLEKPGDMLQHIRTEAGAMILRIGYGYSIAPHSPDPLVDLAERGVWQFSVGTVPGAWLVDTIPLLKYLPEWMPGAGFKSTAREYRATLSEMCERPLQFVKKQMAQQRYEESFVSDIVQRSGKLSPEDAEALMFSAASLYAGGADTSVSTMQSFFLAMMLYPEVQRKAHEEIDRIVGDRMLIYQDRIHLPYVDAVVKEAFRWHVIAPLSIPHAAAEEIMFEGYLIPKNLIIIPNIRWYTHNPAVYSNPELFNPERYLGPSPEPDPKNFVFGFGRRVCPGRHLADSSVWLTVAKSLAMLDIRKGRDADGKEIEPKVGGSGGIVSHPLPFTATIRARSPRHEAVIREVETRYPWTKGDADAL